MTMYYGDLATKYIFRLKFFKKEIIRAITNYAYLDNTNGAFKVFSSW